MKTEYREMQRRYAAMDTERQRLEMLGKMTPGRANRLNDFVHDLQRMLNNVERELTRIGTGN